MIAALLLVSVASAAKCNPAALSKALADATPAGVQPAWSALANCDAATAVAAAPDALSRVIAGEPSDRLVIEAVRLGAGGAVRDWASRLPSDERVAVIKALGGACATEQAVAPFLVESAAALGDTFWSERWYRATVSCNDPAVQDLLRKEVQDPSADRGRFFGALEIFCRNLGKDSIPYLKTLLIMTRDEQELTYVVNAFADAGGAGRPEGPDPEAAKAAVDAIFEMAHQMPQRAVKQARTTLSALGAADREGALAGAYYLKQRDPDGNLHYGLVAVEKATCKSGKVEIAVHRGEVLEPGTMWPEDLRPVAEEAARTAWKFDLAESCKGTGDVRLAMTEAPMDAAALPAWAAGYVEAAKRQGAKKVSVVEEEPIEM